MNIEKMEYNWYKMCKKHGVDGEFQANGLVLVFEARSGSIKSHMIIADGFLNIMQVSGDTCFKLFTEFYTKLKELDNDEHRTN